jgi:hypothetical protein
MINKKQPLTIIVEGESAKVNVDFDKHGVVLRDQIYLDLREYGLAKQDSETPLEYIRRVREYFVEQTPNADSTSETLR